MESLDCNICSPQLTINDFTLPFSSYVSSDFHRIEDDATPGTWQQVKENTPTIIELWMFQRHFFSFYAFIMNNKVLLYNLYTPVFHVSD